MKLKLIPENTVVHTLTEEEAKELLGILHENGYRWNMGGSLISNSKWSGICYTSYHIYPDENVVTWNHFISAGAITFAKFKERYCEEEKPLLKDIDHAIVCNGFNKDGIKDGDKVLVLRYDNANFNAVLNPVIATVIPEKNLEPYTEPETKGKEPGEKGNNSENSQLNLCELLKDCPIGTEFYSPLDGIVKFEGVNPKSEEYGEKPIMCNEGYFCANGKWQEKPNAGCCLFPSRALYGQYPLDPYTAWMTWKEEQKKFGLDIKIETYFEGKFGWEDCDDDVSCLHFHTLADRDKCIEEIKAIIGKYSKK